MLGGAVHISGRRLYDILLVNIYSGGGEFLILKYDQLVHAYCYFAIAILVYYALKKYFKKDNEIPLMIFTILAAIGIGLLNEVVEFGMVLFADASEAVGGYYNTALDLVFNLIGAVFGAIFSSKFLD
jgi:putative membrane protein